MQDIEMIVPDELVNFREEGFQDVGMVFGGDVLVDCAVHSIRLRSLNVGFDTYCCSARSGLVHRCRYASEGNRQLLHELRDFGP